MCLLISPILLMVMNNVVYFFDIIIIGGGFRALVTAYLALKKNKKVLIISKSKKLHGIMSPLKWHGGNFDKGYQFFDGIDEKQKSLVFIYRC